MENITTALSMGQYGIYVWPSYAVATIVIFVMLMITLRSLRQSQRALRNLTDNKD